MADLNLKNVDDKSLFSEVLRRYKCLARPFGSAVLIGQSDARSEYSKQVSEMNCWCLINLEQIAYQKDEKAVEEVFQKIKEPRCSHGAVFDGFPQNLYQARMFDERLAREHVRLDRVIELKEDLKDQEEKEKKSDIIDYYKLQGKVTTIKQSANKDYLSSQLNSIFSKGIYNRSE